MASHIWPLDPHQLEVSPLQIFFRFDFHDCPNLDILLLIQLTSTFAFSEYPWFRHCFIASIAILCVEFYKIFILLIKIFNILNLFYDTSILYGNVVVFGTTRFSSSYSPIAIAPFTGDQCVQEEFIPIIGKFWTNERVALFSSRLFFFSVTSKRFSSSFHKSKCATGIK